MHKMLWSAIGLSVALVACGQPTPQATLSFDPVSYEPVAQQNLASSAQVQMLARDNQQDLHSDFMASVFFLGSKPAARPAQVKSLAEKQMAQKQMARLGLGASVLKSAVTSQDTCEPKVTGNPTDADKDLIPVSAQATASCTDVDDGITFNVAVNASISDKNDQDTWGGFATEAITKLEGNDGGDLVGLRYASKLDDTKQSANQHAFVAQNRFDLLVKGTNNQGEKVDGKLVYTYKQNLTVTRVEDGYNLAVQGTMSVLQSVNNQTGGGKSTYAGQLHISNTQSCKGIDSGSITFNSGPYSAQLVYTGCNQSVVQ